MVSALKIAIKMRYTFISYGTDDNEIMEDVI